MKYFILILFGLFVSTRSYSQEKCDLSTLSQDDKILLQKFWTDLKTAIAEKDKAKLSALCDFPFTCAFCQKMGRKDVNKPYAKITKKGFNRYYYKMFFEEKLATEVSKHSLSEEFIFSTHFNTVDKKCSYSFAYTVREENEKHPGLQYFFDIQKVNGDYKITSTWTVP